MSPIEFGVCASALIEPFTMNHDMKDQALALSIHRSSSRLGELLVADTLVAAGSSALITPAVMIFDR